MSQSLPVRRSDGIVATSGVLASLSQAILSESTPPTLAVSELQADPRISRLARPRTRSAGFPSARLPHTRLDHGHRGSCLTVKSVAGS